MHPRGGCFRGVHIFLLRAFEAFLEAVSGTLAFLGGSCKWLFAAFWEAVSGTLAAFCLSVIISPRIWNNMVGEG